MPHSQALRTLLVGAAFLFGALLIMRFLDGEASRELDDELTPPRIIHVARDTKPTIVRPRDGWLDANRQMNAGDADERFSGDEVNNAQYLAPPVPMHDAATGTLLRR